MPLTVRSYLLAIIVCVVPATLAHANPPPGCHLQFDGLDDRLPTQDIGGGASTLWTVSAWIRTTANFGLRAIVSRGEDVFLDVLPWAMGVTGSGQIYVQIEALDNSGFFCTSNIVLTDSTIANDGAWHHVTALRDESNTVLIYIDGGLGGLVADAICPDAPTTLSTLNATLGIGFSYQANGGPTNPQPANLFFDGEIDEPVVWRVPLTKAEIDTVRLNGPIGVQDSHIVSYWPLDEGAGQRADDIVNNQFGTLGGFPGVDVFDPTWVCPTGINAVPALGPSALVLLGTAMALLAANGLRRRPSPRGR